MHYKREWIVVQKGEMSGDIEETHGEKLERMLRNKFAGKPAGSKKPPVFSGYMLWARLRRMGGGKQPRFYR